MGVQRPLAFGGSGQSPAFLASFPKVTPATDATQASGPLPQDRTASLAFLTAAASPGSRGSSTRRSRSATQHR